MRNRQELHNVAEAAILRRESQNLRLEAISDGVRHIVLPQDIRHKLLLLSPRKPSLANVQKSALLA
jgi:hypothetical protein